MNDENKVSYYAIIPATIRYDPDLKAAEKLLYGEVTALSNVHGYCFAKNKYFAELYDVTNGTVSKWFSHLQKLGYINIELIRNEKKAIIERHIYISDTPYGQKRQYPYCQKKPYPMVENDIDNNININIDEDDLFNLIINKDKQIPNSFYEYLDKLDLLYTKEILDIGELQNSQMIKEIIYTVYEIYKSRLIYLLAFFKRSDLINLYNICKDEEDKGDIDDFIAYYKRSLINKYADKIN